MKDIKLYYATVIDNDDQNHDDGKKKGRIKIKVLPEMKDISNSYLPWVRPFITEGMSDSGYSYNSPEIDDKVWVIFLDNYWKNGYYIKGSFIDGFFNYADIETELNNITESVDTTYPNLKFYYTPDGSLFFFNTDSGDKGIYNSNGSYQIWKGDGTVYIYAKDQEIEVYNDNISLYLKDDGEALLENSNGYLKLTTAGVLENGGNSQSLVTHAELDSALQSFKSSIDSAIASAIIGHTHGGVTSGSSATSPGSGSANSVSVDISSSESDKYKEG